MSRPVNSNVPEDGFRSKKDFLDKGRIADADLTIYNSADPSKVLNFDASSSMALTPIAQQTWTVSGFGTATNLLVNSQVVGNSLILTGKFTAGTVAASAASINLPSGYTINTALLPAAAFLAGIFHSMDATNAPNGRAVFYDGSTNNKLFICAAGVASDLAKSNGDVVASTSDNCYFQAIIPISGF